MVKFRVITNGNVFRVQKRASFFWIKYWSTCMHRNFDGYQFLDEPREFESESEAVEWIRENHDDKPDKWTVCK